MGGVAFAQVAFRAHQAIEQELRTIAATDWQDLIDTKIGDWSIVPTVSMAEFTANARVRAWLKGEKNDGQGRS